MSDLSSVPRPFARLPIVLALLATSTACVSKTVVVKRHNGSDSRGVAYALPRTLLKITVPYTIQETKKTEQGRSVETKNAPKVVVVEPVKLETVPVADERNRFVISGKDVSDDWLLESSLGFTVDEHGLLLGVESEAKDKTFEALQAFVTTGINIAKFVAVAGPETPPDALKGITERIKELYAEAAPPRTNGKVTRPSPDKLQGLQKELALLLDFVATYEKTNQETVSARTVEYVAYVDPATCPKVPSGGVECKVQADGLGKGIPKTSLPVVTVLVDATDNDLRAATLPVMKDDTSKPGIAYRIARPTPVRVKVSFDTVSYDVGESRLAIAQFGPVAFLDVASKGGSTRKTSATLDGSGLRAYKVDSGSTADKGLEAIAASIESAQKAVTAIRYDLKLEQLTKQKQLQDAAKALEPTPGASEGQQQLDALKQETELLKAQAELEKARAELEKARKGED